MLKRKFDDIYPIKEDFKRFDSRNTAFNRATKSGLKSYRDKNKKAERMKKQLPGFSLLDYSFNEAALTVAQASDSGRGYMNSGFYSWSSLGVTKKPEEISKWEVSPYKAVQVLRKAGLYYGAVDIGFCKLDKRWIYSYSSDGKPIIFEDVEEAYETSEKAVIPESHKWIIVITVPMEFKEMMYAPAALNPVSNMGYSRMSIVAGSLAEFIRGLGYNAIPCGNDIGLSIPMAIQAGLGHVGRHGRLITWEHGPMVRICKILTNLPLESSLIAPEGVVQYCEVCKKCAEHCPSQSIPYGSRIYEGYSEANNPGALK
jgi:ferredoxin